MLDNKKSINLKNKNKNKLSPLNNNNVNTHKLPENNNNSKSKKRPIETDKTNYSIKGSKILSNGKTKEKMPIYHKKIDKNNKLLLINKLGKNKMNNSCDNAKNA